MSLNLIFRLDLLHPPLTGIGYYVFYLLRELLQHPDIDDLVGFDITGVKQKTALLELMQEDNLSSHTSSRFRHLIQKTPVLYACLKKLTDIKERFDISSYDQWLYHEPSFLALPHEGPTVVTIHDLSHIRFPETHPKSRISLLNKELPKTLERATHIITDSHFICDELLALNLVQDANKISVAHLGVDPIFHPYTLDILKKYLIDFGLAPQAYLLSVGTLEPRKNISRLLKAYNALSENIRRAFPLVLTGTKGWKNEDILRQIDHVPLPGKIIFTGYLSREKLAILMSGAAAFVFPSLYEGFGLPVLEAMASGVPVVTSNNSALKEISGDCTLLVDPLDIEDISDKLTYVLENKDKANKLKEKGKQRAQHFSWKHCADSTIDVYKKTLSQDRS